MSTSNHVVLWSDDPEHARNRAREVLLAGGIVAIPTETVYGLALLPGKPEALNKLWSLKGEAQRKPISLAVSSLAQVESMQLELPARAKKLADRYWPGPLTLVLSDPEGHQVGVRVPGKPEALALIEHVGQPILVTRANKGGQEDACSAEEVKAAFPHGVDLIIDGGPSPLRQPSSVIRFSGNNVEILREGFLTKDMIFAMVGHNIWFVCTGNTCRSPMAEAMLRGLIADKLGIPAADLHKQGIAVSSAGVACYDGSPISPHSVEALKRLSFPPPTDHASHALTQQDIATATHLFAMTPSHLAQIKARFPDAEARVLRRDGKGIADPIGGSLEDYIACGKEIQAEVEAIVAELFS